MDQAMGHDAVIDVSVETLQGIASLETSWKELEARSIHSFYLPWLWIGTWLRHLSKIQTILRLSGVEHAV